VSFFENGVVSLMNDPSTNSGRVNKLAVRAYMDNFDFSGLRLDLAFR